MDSFKSFKEVTTELLFLSISFEFRVSTNGALYPNKANISEFSVLYDICLKL